jgi:hypothetical protein
MSKTIEQWVLFEYVGLEFTPLSKPFKTREQVEKAPESRAIAVWRPGANRCSN